MDKSIIKEDILSNIFTLDNIPRCPNCNLISSLNLYYKESKQIINYYCENNHYGDISLEEYLQKYNNHSLLKEKCDECNKIKMKLKEIIYIVINVISFYAIYVI